MRVAGYSPHTILRDNRFIGWRILDGTVSCRRMNSRTRRTGQSKKHRWTLPGGSGNVLVGFLILLLTGCSVIGSDPPPPVTPTPTQIPTPTPPPPPLAHCYQSRTTSASVRIEPAVPPAASATPGSPAAGAVASPPPSPPVNSGNTEPSPPNATPAPSPFVLRPASTNSVFQHCQVVSFYGTPLFAGLGALGTDTPAAIAQRIKEQAAGYEQTSGGRGVAPAFHVIYAIAQASSTPDGSYLERLDDAHVREYLDAAKQEDLLMFLDIQMGHSTVEAELPHVLPYLQDPRVHLALDPEFATPPDQEPGDVIGGMDAAEINKAQEALQKLVDEYHLPNKILVIHQFWPEMIRNKEALQQFPNVDLVIDMDGFGAANEKIAGYERFVKEDRAEHGGFKLFYEQDTGLMTPDQVNRMEPQPDLVIYQ